MIIDHIENSVYLRYRDENNERVEDVVRDYKPYFYIKSWDWETEFKQVLAKVSCIIIKTIMYFCSISFSYITSFFHYHFFFGHTFAFIFVIEDKGHLHIEHPAPLNINKYFSLLNSQVLHIAILFFLTSLFVNRFHIVIFLKTHS